MLGDQLGLNMTDSLVKECTAKIKAMADVRKLAVEDIDTILRSFYDNLGRANGKKMDVEEFHKRQTTPIS